MSRLELPGYDAVGIRADNPSPFTLAGTNTWIYGRDPGWVIDPGPALPEHLDAISEELDERGGLGAVLLTHDHHDHSEAVPELITRFSPAPLAAARGAVTTLLSDGDRYGPFEVIATPGHAPDHLTFLTDDGIAFTGDAVLGEGSVFVMGQLGEYLEGLRRLRAQPLSLIAPGHGPVVTDPQPKLSEYIDHRLARETALITALAEGKRTTHDLLDAAWSDAPAELRGAAAMTLEAHLEKLESEGRLPPDVERGGSSTPAV
ncbi:MAG TPA: MBL fold metallo-hydrolase [Solirubrobacteraceae bacterium]|jgi:glyoxylase-like metal-dependent hydrolase (beta-lactamase superfamily II)|nr:MBL fold metallo-hydrolase [Solirubrobacteraceae bacterium]